MIRLRSRTTATWRDKIAVGTNRRPIWRICSPKPGISLWATASVASGVTSRSAGPVPPVVSTRLQPRSTSSISVALMPACSSGIRRCSKTIGLHSARPSQSCSACRPWSAKTPLLARSLIETMPILTGSWPWCGSLRWPGVSLIVVLLMHVRHIRATQMPAHQLEQFAVSTALARCQALRQRGLARRWRTFAGLANQCAQLLRIGAGARGHPGEQRRVIGNQPVAPLFGLVQQQFLGGRTLALRRQGLARGLHQGRFEPAHDLAHILQLAALALEVGDAPGLGQGLHQIVRQTQRIEQIGAQVQQLLAQRLQASALAPHIGAGGVGPAFAFGLELNVLRAAFGNEPALDEIAFLEFA